MDSGWLAISGLSPYPAIGQAGGAGMLTVIVLVVAVLLVVGLFIMMAPKKCPTCKVGLKPLDPFSSGRTKKFRCPKCGKIVDTGIPVGRGRRR